MSKDLEQKLEKLERNNAYYKSCLDGKDEHNQNSMITFFQIINNIDANIYWKDLKGRFLGMNKNNLAMLGQDIQYSDIFGKTDADFTKGMQYKNDIHSNDIKIINDGIGGTFEEKYISSDEQERIYLATKNCLKDNDGNIIGLVGISIDITKQNKLQIDLEENIELLKSMEQNILDTKEAFAKALIGLK